MMEISFDEIYQLNQSKYQSKYKPITTIAKGAFGPVIKSKDLQTSNEVAVKILSKETCSQSTITQLIREITVLQNVNHPNIVKLYDYFETSNEVYIIMEYIKGGTLMDFISKNKGHITEEQSKEIIYYALKAIEYLHTFDICHRDIKPENIMFNEDGVFSTLKIIDFGLSTKIEVKEEKGFCGTVMYMAPESLFGLNYSKEIDLWSLGIVLFMLLNQGKHPFYENGDSKEMYKKKCKSEKIRMFYHVSRNAKSLLAHLMEVQQHLRYTAETALKHKWFTEMNHNNEYNNNNNKSTTKTNIHNKYINTDNITANKKLSTLLYIALFIKHYPQLVKCRHIYNLKSNKLKAMTHRCLSSDKDKEQGTGSSTACSIEDDFHYIKKKDEIIVQIHKKPTHTINNNKTPLQRNNHKLKTNPKPNQSKSNLSNIKHQHSLYPNLKKNATHASIPITDSTPIKTKVHNVYPIETKAQRNNSYNKYKLVLGKHHTISSTNKHQNTLSLSKLETDFTPKKQKLSIISHNKITSLISNPKTDSQRCNLNICNESKYKLSSNTQRKSTKQFHTFENNEIVQNFLTLATEGDANNNVSNSRKSKIYLDIKKSTRYKKQSLVLPFIAKPKPNYGHRTNKTII